MGRALQHGGRAECPASEDSRASLTGTDARRTRAISQANLDGCHRGRVLCCLSLRVHGLQTMTAFDREAALRYAGQEDRDAASFFAGRDAERAAFRAGLALAHSAAEDGGDPRTVLRIFQGAPGCGKTSFVRRMRAENDDVLFVQVEKAHLRSLALLRERICDAALKADKGRNIVASLASAGMELIRLREAGRKATSFAAESATENTRLVIWKDEAQVLEAPCDALVEAHQGMLGVPVLVVLSGLQHTDRLVRAIPGLSRLSSNAVVHMGGLRSGECADSTRQMMVAFGVEADDPSVEKVGRRVEEMSVGWPQHLKGAQTALAEQLVAVNGDLSRIDLDAVERESDASRAAYYTQRLDSGLLADDRNLAIRILSRIGDGNIDCSLNDMIGIMREEANAAGSRRSRKEAAAYLQDMVGHGLLTRRQSPTDITLDRWQVAVPSMVDWASSAFQA